MTEQWSAEVRDLFDALVDLDAHGREERLRQRGPGGTVLREVAELLAVADEAGDFLGVLGGDHIGAAPEPGETIAHRYVVERRLATGAMGDVYLARDRQLERQVALKSLRAAARVDIIALDRILFEARVSARLDHPHVATVYDIARADDGRLFIVMAYYAGPTLRERIRTGPLPTDEALRIAAQIADALGAAHDAGIVHRDVKPGNVLFDAAGSVRLADFGIATLADREMAGVVAAAGTLAYMSPEQARGACVDGRSDLWSLGVVLHEMLTGQRPSGVASAAELPVEPHVRALIGSLLQHDPAARPSSAPDVSRALRGLMRCRVVATAGRPGVAARGFIPATVTRFIGRERERALAARLLHEARLLTITGAGGTGKTRLALEVCADVSHRFADGLWFIPLADIPDARLLPSRIAQALGLRPEGESAASDDVLAELRGRHALLVLDTFEHLLEGARFVAALLASCPAVTVLATSRAALAIRGEQELLVAPLTTPLPNDATAAESDAVRLFVQRARAVRASFSLDGDALQAVVEICRRLDGLPLAIELAAAWVRLLSPQAILSRLERRFELLRAHVADRPVRHRSLRATIDWSYARLRDEERVVLERIAVFTRSISAAEAAAALPSLATETDAADTFDVLASLCRKNLLHQEDGPDGEPRFFMLETVREFALERPRAMGQESDPPRRQQGRCLTPDERGAGEPPVAASA